MALVLCTGVDAGLMRSRKLLLERAGHTVITVSDLRELEAACERYQFDAAVLGQSISQKMKRALALKVRYSCPSAKILELYPAYDGKTLDNADFWLETTEATPDQLIEIVNELTRAHRS